jgi:Ca-activated chloride channel homolog
MTLLNPLALLLASLIGLVVWLHFKRPKRIQYVSNLHLWQAGGTEADDRRPILQRIRKNRLLILQILFLSLVVLALARPSLLFWHKSRAVVLVFDCSVSMNARESGGTRLELVREKALQLLKGIGSGDRVLIVQGRPQPVLNSYSGSDKNSLRRALEGLSATESSPDIDRALMVGLSSVEKTEDYEAFLFSDGTQPIHLPGNNARVHYIQVGKSDNNAAITRLSVRSNPFSPYDREIYAEAANFSSRAQKFQLQLTLEGAPLIDQTVELDPGQRKSFPVKAPPTGKGMAKASIAIQDDLIADNSAAASLDLKKISVLLVTTGNQYLEKALRVNPRFDGTVKKPEQCAQDDFKRFGVIILDGAMPQQLPPANYFIIDHPSGAASIMGKDAVSSMPSHPVMSFVNLRNITIEEALPLKIGPSETVLIESKGKPLMAASEAGRFRMVRLGFDVRSSNLPLTLSFPVLISNAVNWLGSRTDESVSQSIEQESNIKPTYTPQIRDERFSEKPVLARTGWELHRLLLLLSFAVFVVFAVFAVHDSLRITL